MRYSYEYKLRCVELYRKGEWPEPPKGITKENFHSTIRKWYRIEEAQGPEALKHTGTNKVWSPEEKLELISKALSAFCGAQRIPMHFRADAMHNITDALK